MKLETVKSTNAPFIFILFLVYILFFNGCASTTRNMKKSDIDAEVSVKLITGITSTEDENSVYVSIKGDRPLTYTSVKQPFPAGVILYFPSTALDNTGAVKKTDNDIIESINASELNGKGKTTRVVISLKKNIPYDVTREGSGIKIIFNKAQMSAAKVDDNLQAGKDGFAETKKDAKSDKILPEKKITEEKISVKKKLEKKTGGKPAWINRIDFSSEDAGKSSFVIGTNRPVKYVVKKISEKKIQIKLFNTRLPDYRKRPLITTRFDSAVNRIIPFQTASMKSANISMAAIELREEVPYTVEEVDNFILLHFEASSIPPKPSEEVKLPYWKEVVSEAVLQLEEEDKYLADKPMDKEAGFFEPGPKYTGEKIALDFFETDIKNVFRIIREISGKNFAIDKNVKGKVTLSFEKPVPWDQIFDLVLRMNHLGKVEDGDIVRIATLKTLIKEEKERRAKTIAEQKANQQEVELAPVFTEYIPISYSDAQEDIVPSIEKILTKKVGSVIVDDHNNQIIIRDVYNVIKEARQIVKRIDKVTPQVIIEARIVEASSSFARSIGVEWGAAGGPLTNQLGHLGGDLNYNMAVNLGVANTGSVGIDFSRLIGTPFALDARLMAMETQNKLKVISSPKIVTLDNKTATIKQGESYPYNKLDESGNTTTEFKEIELVLEVTPHVTPDNRIAMTISIKKDDIKDSSNGASYTKEVETELLVNDGETVVIGGIIKSSNRDSREAIPLFSRIPIIGYLFKNNAITDDKEELLIFISPRIIRFEQRSYNIGAVAEEEIPPQ